MERSRRGDTGKGWAARRLEDVPRVAAGEPGPAWHAIQHAFGLTAFGANAFTAQQAGDVLVEEHDESGSGQEELYVVLAGRARFTLDREHVDTSAVTVVAVRDATVRRTAVALEIGTTLLAIGGKPRADFRSTWRTEHFSPVPRLL